VVEIDCSGPDITVSPLKEKVPAICVDFPAMFRIRIHVFFGFPDPIRGMDPDQASSILMQK
jgi:hypothetical protein